MTTMTLRRTARRFWTLSTGADIPQGTLRTGRGLVHAEATTAEGTWSVRSHGPRRRRVTAGPPGTTALELDPPLARRDLLGRWETTRGFRHYRALLTCDTGRIAARASALRGGAVEVEVTGDHSDLVVLTVCFALLSRRRRDQMTALWVAAITSHGPR
ncbi:hypothetical protein OG799_10595 [Micromonospora sp. NBC_00898]|uniref:hypothetical protein n=1 Tax=Micromonospora sp. NBC_00898 TaxID=2975981 RepID=UPI00386E224A|nr:hypothetical protein OG799_10595 [Micromonospora sp. NBC_00898]